MNKCRSRPAADAVLRAAVVTLIIVLAGCATKPPVSAPARPAGGYVGLSDRSKAAEVVLFSFGLIDVGYRFGGRNPDAGLDCSGMVSYIYQQVAGLKLPHSAAEIARLTRPIERGAIKPGDLVFFNTRNQPFSHVGIYVGDDRFVHAPNSNGKVRVESIRSAYFATRFEAARSLFRD